MDMSWDTIGWSLTAGAVVIAAYAVAFVIYFLPVGVAALRSHRNTTAIFYLTLLLGWTLLGWGVALVWSFTAPAES
jgi:hypothetical protein